MAIKKNEFTQTIKQIKKIAGLPRVKNPISKSDDGLFGQIYLALRYKTEQTTTWIAANIRTAAPIENPIL